METKFQKKAAKAKAKAKLKEMKNKQEAYELLATEYPKTKDYVLADLVRNLPTQRCLSKMKSSLNAFTAILTLSVAYKYFFALYLFMHGTWHNHFYLAFPVIFTLLLIGVFARDGKSIRNVSFLGYFNIVAGIPIALDNFEYFLITDVALTLVTIMYSIFLSNRMFPKYEFSMKYGTNSKGQKRGIKVIRFPEKTK